MLRNLDASFGLVFSQPVLLALIESGRSRDDAYRIVQRNAMRAWQEERSFRELLVADPEVSAALDGARLDACFDLKRALGERRAYVRRAGSDGGDAVVASRWVNRAALPHLYSGKVRELYEVAYDQLLIVASDRVSVFDVVLPDEIPDKGRVLTGLSQFWFDQTAGIVPNHVISCDPTDFPPTAGAVGGRAMLVRATRPIRLECVVRGYLFGAAWTEYAERGTVGGFPVPAGLRQAERLPTPLVHADDQGRVGSRPAAHGAEAADLVGADVYERCATSRSGSTSWARRAPTRTGSCSPTPSSSSASSTTRSS